MTNESLNATDSGMPDESAGGGESLHAPVVLISAEQLYALCLAVARAVEDDRPSPEVLAVRSVLASVEEQLLLAWADVQIAFWDADGPGAGGRGTGVA